MTEERKGDRRDVFREKGKHGCKFGYVWTVVSFWE